MRIENSSQVSHSSHPPPVFTVPKKGWNSTDSIRCGGCSSTFWNILLTIKRKIADFFRAIFFCFPPSKPKAPVHVPDKASVHVPDFDLTIPDIDLEKSKKIPVIEYQRSKIEDPGMVYRYRILVNGVETRNEIIVRDKISSLYVCRMKFPDIEMREHINAILEHILREEQTEQFSTDRIKFAQIFWNAGFTTQNKIRFVRDGSEPISRLITNIISEAKKKQEKLNDHCHAALMRIEEKSAPGIWDSIFSSVVDLGHSEIALSDLLLLMEVVDANPKAICFDTFDHSPFSEISNIVEFKKTSLE